MMKHGFVKVHRALFASRFWREKRKYSHFEALADLLRNAYFGTSPVTLRVKGQPVGVGRGDYVASLSFMARRWGWSVKAVRTFVRDLQREGMARVVSRDPVTVLNLSACFTDEGPKPAPAVQPAEAQGAYPAAPPQPDGSQEHWLACLGLSPEYQELLSACIDAPPVRRGQPGGRRGQEAVYPAVAAALGEVSACVAGTARGTGGGAHGSTAGGALFGAVSEDITDAESDGSDFPF